MALCILSLKEGGSDFWPQIIIMTSYDVFKPDADCGDAQGPASAAGLTPGNIEVLTQRNAEVNNVLTEGAQNPFFSPDGRTIAFFAGRRLWTMYVGGCFAGGITNFELLEGSIVGLVRGSGAASEVISCGRRVGRGSLSGSRCW